MGRAEWEVEWGVRRAKWVTLDQLDLSIVQVWGRRKSRMGQQRGEEGRNKGEGEQQVQVGTAGEQDGPAGR